MAGNWFLLCEVDVPDGTLINGKSADNGNYFTGLIKMESWSALAEKSSHIQAFRLKGIDLADLAVVDIRASANRLRAVPFFSS